MDEDTITEHSAALYRLTLVHFSAQIERVSWNRG
jgi:hypothetical protein